ncbi:MAG: aminotransferase class I/II-fold pyridoxal phosphate-dependent enzyme [Syntrophaceae bacterium]|nr:aminotransferase class I/II-fold pyridoxal phosphate-dependent enzyme [Syntrophaceae bacterium]
MKIEKFEMMRMQCLYEKEVEFDLSETTVLPLRVSELLDGEDDVKHFIANELYYPESQGSPLFRERIAQFYTDCKPENITVTNGGSEANYVTLWALLEPGGRLACMIPNYMQAWGLGRAYADGVDAFLLMKQKEADQYRWTLDLEGLKRAVTPKTNVILITNPNNPTGAVLTAAEMDAVVDVARKAGVWLVVDEVYRGAEVQGGTTPSFWGRYEKVVITSGLSKAFGLGGLRTGWVVAPPKLIEELRVRLDYLTCTPSLLSDHLGTIVMEPQRRESILARARRIIRENLPPIEEWFLKRDDIFTYVRPEAGAFVYCEYKLPINSTELINRLRVEQSVLLTAGDQHGLDKGIRTGFGFGIEKTLKGLARVEALMRSLK